MRTLQSQSTGAAELLRAHRQELAEIAQTGQYLDIIFFSTNVEKFQILKEAGFNIYKTREGENLLSFAIKNNYVELVNYLIEQKYFDVHRPFSNTLKYSLVFPRVCSALLDRAVFDNIGIADLNHAVYSVFESTPGQAQLRNIRAVSEAIPQTFASMLNTISIDKSSKKNSLLCLLSYLKVEDSRHYIDMLDKSRFILPVIKNTKNNQSYNLIEYTVAYSRHTDKSKLLLALLQRARDTGVEYQSIETLRLERSRQNLIEALIRTQTHQLNFYRPNSEQRLLLAREFPWPQELLHYLTVQRTKRAEEEFLDILRSRSLKEQLESTLETRGAGAQHRKI